MPYCSFVLCRKETGWLFRSEDAQAIWYTCSNCEERYAVYKMTLLPPSLLTQAATSVIHKIQNASKP